MPQINSVLRTETTSNFPSSFLNFFLHLHSFPNTPTTTAISPHFRMSFSDILCCLRGKTNQGDDDEQTIDERSHLIPTTNDQPPPTPSIAFVDPVRFRERLGTIVRAKEGRMVNVVPNYRSSAASSFTMQRDRSHVSSGISSSRTRSISGSDSVQDTDFLASAPHAFSQAHFPEPSEAGGNLEPSSAEITRESHEGSEGDSTEDNAPAIVVSTPAKPIEKPIVPTFDDDPNLKLSLSWGD
ncbi:hypothetical protein D9757_001276 [Collybiopsis confluens]|uniref:Uncharacterized protein n=1 Tax=Collybiopsis confluens TaxID=2823264 RepID=A0A8H5I1B5_9AGAR|nr:hypothetical protein D9757_001276 [Collybiopsis confluens]